MKSVSTYLHNFLVLYIDFFHLSRHPKLAVGDGFNLEGNKNKIDQIKNHFFIIFLFKHTLQKINFIDNSKKIVLLCKYIF